MSLFLSHKLLWVFLISLKKTLKMSFYIYILFHSPKNQIQCSPNPPGYFYFLLIEVLWFLISGKQQHCSLSVKSLPELNSNTFVAIPLLHSRIPELPAYHLGAGLSVFFPLLRPIQSQLCT